MPLVASIPYRSAVAIASAAEYLAEQDQLRLIRRLAAWAPEVVATAIMDLGLEAARGGPPPAPAVDAAWFVPGQLALPDPEPAEASC